MSEKPRIYKFGGAALRDADAIRNTGSIIAGQSGKPLLVVLSAMGKTTDALEQVVAAHAREDGGAISRLEEVKRAHFETALALVGEDRDLLSALNDLFVEIEWVLEEPPHASYDFMYDQVVSFGELLSSRIVEAYLRSLDLPVQWLDARDAVRTDNLFREAWVDWETTCAQMARYVSPALDSGKMVLTQGFIGSTSENFTTTLGRAGSDFSAAIFAHCLDAADMTIWKDVPGMLTADPRYFPDAQLLEELSYAETVEMTYYGATVIHLRTIKPLQSKGIRLYVKSFMEPDAPGTLISARTDLAYPPMQAVERDQAFLRLSTRDYSFVAEHHMRDILTLICDLRLQVNLMQGTGMYFFLCLNDHESRVDKLADTLSPAYEIHIDRNIELLTIRHFRPEQLERVMREREILYIKQIPETVQVVLRAV